MFVARKIGTKVRGRHYAGLAPKNPDGTYEANDGTYEEAASSVTGICSLGSISDSEFESVVDTQSPKCNTKGKGPPLAQLTATEKIERMKISILGIEVDDIDLLISNEIRRIISIEDYIETLHKMKEDSEDRINNLKLNRKKKTQELAQLRRANVTDSTPSTKDILIQPLRKRAGKSNSWGLIVFPPKH